MVASLLPNGKQQFLDSNGDPLAGGSVFFYIPTTTDFKDTWKDPGQTVKNSNPVVLDAAGEAVIYGSGSYRQVVKDVFGNTVWDELTAGGVGGSGSSVIFHTATLTTLAGLDPSLETVYLDQSGRAGVFEWDGSNLSVEVALDTAQGVYVAPTSDPSGASGAWVRSFVGDILSSWFGLDEAGAAGVNASVLTAFLNYWKNDQNLGAKVENGVFNLDGFFDLSKLYGVIEGTGRTVLQYTGADTGGAPIFDITGPAVGYQFYQKFSNLTLQGNENVTGGVFHTHRLHHTVFENLVVNNCNVAAVLMQVEFAVLNQYHKLELSDNRVDAKPETRPYTALNLGSGTTSATQTIACSFYDLIIEHCGNTGLILTNAWFNSFHGGSSEGNGSLGVYIGPDSQHNIFTNFFCEANTNGDFFIEGDGNILDQCEAASTAATTLHITGNNNIIRGGRYGNIIIDAGAVGNIFIAPGLFDGATVSDAGTGTQGLDTIYRLSTGVLISQQTFLPTFAGTTTDGSISYTIQTGSYRKSGGKVDFTLTLQINGITTAPTGNLLIKGLPIPATAAAAVSFAAPANITLPASTSQYTGIIQPGTSEIALYGTGSGFSTPIPTTALGSALIIVTGSYSAS